MSKLIWTWPNSEVIRVIDGDSFIAKVHRDLDFGFHVLLHSEAEIRMRLNRINCPKLASPAGQAAREAVIGLYTPKFMIETVGPYKYGDEWMAEVTLPDGRNVSDVLVSTNNAVYWDGSGVRPDDTGPVSTT